MPDEKQSPQCTFHVESMKQMANDIRDLNKKVADIPVLITKLEQFIDATKKMQEDLEVVAEMSAKIMLLERQVMVLEKEKENLHKSFEDFKKDDFKPVKEAMSMAKGMALLLPPIWTVIMLIIQHVWK